jgi:hypothetical protein
VSVDGPEVDRLSRGILEGTDRLEALFPGRTFTPDGHLVGSIGEVVAAHMFGLELQPASTLGHDAKAPDGRRVEIKFTQSGQVAFRHRPDHALVLARPHGDRIEVVFHGPGTMAWDDCGPPQRNGQRSIGPARLRFHDSAVEGETRLLQVAEAPL